MPAIVLFGSHIKTDNANRLAHPENICQVAKHLTEKRNYLNNKIDKIMMAAVASFSVLNEKGQCQLTSRPRKL